MTVLYASQQDMEQAEPSKWSSENKHVLAARFGEVAMVWELEMFPAASVAKARKI